MQEPGLSIIPRLDLRFRTAQLQVAPAAYNKAFQNQERSLPSGRLNATGFFDSQAPGEFLDYSKTNYVEGESYQLLSKICISLLLLS